MWWKTNKIIISLKDNNQTCKYNKGLLESCLLYCLLFQFHFLCTANTNAGPGIIRGRVWLPARKNVVKTKTFFNTFEQVTVMAVAFLCVPSAVNVLFSANKAPFPFKTPFSVVSTLFTHPSRPRQLFFISWNCTRWEYLHDVATADLTPKIRRPCMGKATMCRSYFIFYSTNWCYTLWPYCSVEQIWR